MWGQLCAIPEICPPSGLDLGRKHGGLTDNQGKAVLECPVPYVSIIIVLLLVYFKQNKFLEKIIYYKSNTLSRISSILAHEIDIKKLW